MFGELIDDGFQVERRFADPIGQHGTVQIKARTGKDLPLTV